MLIVRMDEPLIMIEHRDPNGEAACGRRETPAERNGAATVGHSKRAGSYGKTGRITILNNNSESSIPEE